MYTSLKVLYKKLMFPKGNSAGKWTLAEIDELDVHFFYELMDEFDLLEEHENKQVPQEKEVYLSEIW